MAEDLLGRERDAEVVVEVRLARRDPGEGPAHALFVGGDLADRRAGDRGEGDVAGAQVDGGAVEAVGPERAVRAAGVPLGREHEVVDDELAAAAEQVGQGQLPVRPVEDVVLGDFLPGQVAALPGQRLALAAELFLPGQKGLTGFGPGIVRHDLVPGVHQASPELMLNSFVEYLIPALLWSTM